MDKITNTGKRQSGETDPRSPKNQKINVTEKYNRQKLFEAEEFLNLLNVGFVNASEVGEVTFLFFCFLGQDMTFESVFSFDFS